MANIPGNGEMRELMEYIGNLHNDQMEAIGKVKDDVNALAIDFAGHKADINARVKTIEEDQKDDRKQRWIHSIGVSLIAAAHQIGHTLLNWKI